MSPEIFAEIEKLCQRGDIFFTGAKYIRAIEQYRAALKLVPEPVEEHDAATWIYAAIGDSYFSSGSYQESAQTFLKSLSSPKALHNPFINLRLGQSFFEIGERNKAAGFLAQAYMSEGREIFEGEEPHYFEFLKTQIRPPEDGKW
jgi:tetratricopeptide (TPR) repeat protein